MNRSHRRMLVLSLFSAAAAVAVHASAPHYTIKPIPASSVHHGWSDLPRLKVQESTSSNWGGYAVPLETSTAKDTFTLVEGAWKVPTVTGGKTATYSSTWVGLDGYGDGTVEQTGSEQDWSGTGQANYVWFEMYPNAAYEIVGFPANPGDLIFGQVKYVGTSKSSGTPSYVFQVTIENLTRGVAFVVPSSYTTVRTAARGSAEWVAEAPYAGRVLPLADFGQAMFVDCEATGAGTYSVSKGKSGVLEPISFWPDDPLTMVDPNGGRATPSALMISGTAFDVTWAAK